MTMNMLVRGTLALGSSLLLLTACGTEDAAIGGSGGDGGDSTGTSAGTEASGGIVTMTSGADATATGGSGADTTGDSTVSDSMGTTGPATATDTDSDSSTSTSSSSGGSTGAPEVCGDDMVIGAELCDGTDLAGEDCASQGFDDGVLTCANDCASFDTTACFACGDDVAAGTEVCDGLDIGGETCLTQGFDSGMLGCQVDCSGYDTTGCFTCGDGVIEGMEMCDAANLGGETCTTQGFDSGTLACQGDCFGFDTSACIAYTGDCCANNGSPGCDDAACTAAICAADASCCGFSWDAGCAAAAVVEPACQDVGGSCPACGDDAAEGTEVCDGTDLGGQTCVGLGFDVGTLACQADCGAFDTSSCVDFAGDCCAANGTVGCDDAGCTAAICAADPTCCGVSWGAGCAAAAVLEPACQDVGGSCPACGDDVTEGTEVCDGTDVGGQDCIGLGFDGGTLSCQSDCSALDPSTCRDIGFGDCLSAPPGVACLPQEQCITDLAVPPTQGVCTDPLCTTVADCPLAQPGGTAAVQCIDVTGEGINECIMFCGLPGLVCPPGMFCALGIACAWPAP
jgi:hypothetical protein